MKKNPLTLSTCSGPILNRIAFSGINKRNRNNESADMTTHLKSLTVDQRGEVNAFSSKLSYFADKIRLLEFLPKYAIGYSSFVWRT